MARVTVLKAALLLGSTAASAQQCGQLAKAITFEGYGFVVSCPEQAREVCTRTWPVSRNSAGCSDHELRCELIGTRTTGAQP